MWAQWLTNGVLAPGLHISCEGPREPKAFAVHLLARESFSGPASCPMEKRDLRAQQRVPAVCLQRAEGDRSLGQAEGGGEEGGQPGFTPAALGAEGGLVQGWMWRQRSEVA